jgi:predicted anti-sigma-YlaC factor YlaD
MKNSCKRTDEIVTSMRIGITPDADSHLAECEECRAAVSAGDWMRQFSNLGREEVPVLPDPRRIWLMAEWQRRQRSSPGRMRLIDCLQWAAYGIAAVAPAIWFTFRWPQLVQWVSTLRGGEAAWISAGSSPVLWTAVALGGITTLVTLQLVFAEE